MNLGYGFGMDSVWGPIIASLIMVLGIIIAWLIVSGSRKGTPPSPSDEKLSTYACGEDVKEKRTTYSDIEVDETRPHGERFFSPIWEVFRGFYDNIRPGHSGDLSTYLLWLASGIVVLFALIWIIFL